jgi:FMN phosphatase YigB (HAD superfamily)
LADLAISPEKAILVDDNPENIAGAEAAGITGVVFRSVEQTNKALSLWTKAS